MSELLGASPDALDRVAESLSAGARRMQDIRTSAERAVAELRSGWSGPDSLHLTQPWEQQTSPQLAGASASLDSCVTWLRAQSAAQRLASTADLSSTGTSGLILAGTASSPTSLPSQPPLPPEHGSPAGNAIWWKSLSPGQQAQVVQEHPDWVGSRDGVSFTARDQANRALLSVNRSGLETERRLLETDSWFGADSWFGGAFANNDSWFGGAFANDDAALAQVKDKLASLDAIERTLDPAENPGERQLLMLDLSRERAEAAIALGNVDTADNVAVFVPGLSSGVSASMLHYDGKMGLLKHQTELESKRANLSQTAATVTWIGYQAPQTGWDLVGGRSVTSDLAARDGAARLVPFLQGIGAARERDAHLTLLGHSYGSTTAGLALQQSTGVDDAVFFGSPGLHTSHLDELKVPAGHTYYIEARHDAVGDLGYFGIDPSHLAGIEHASARESSVVDPVTGEIQRFTEATGHSGYLVDRSTSQYNMSLITGGLADRLVHDGGQDFGDILSWPVPGTY